MSRFVKIFLWALVFSAPAYADSGEKTANADEKVAVHMQTSQGEIVLELDPQRAPVTVKNFVEYANAGFYDGTVFHRVIPGFMIQGGGFEPGMVKKETRAPIKNESRDGLRNTVGSIAMARTRNPDSATAQFFINTGNNTPLDYPSQGGYCVFGKVTAGMDVVRSIENTPRGKRGMFGDVPVDDVVINKVTVEHAVSTLSTPEKSANTR